MNKYNINNAVETDHSQIPQDEVITDYQLLFHLQQKIKDDFQNHKIKHSRQLYKILHCVKHSKDNGVALYQYEHQNKSRNLGIKGAIHCHSAFCPICAPYRMDKYKQLLHSAFKMFEQENKACIMVTLTIPNSKALDFYQNFSVLKCVLNMFQMSGTWKLFRKLTNIVASFYSFDVTYGYNGWHPHYHCLFWLDKIWLKEKKSELEDWEVRLHKVWDKQIWKIINDKFEVRANDTQPYFETVRKIDKSLYSESIKQTYNVNTDYKQIKTDTGFYISKKDNHIINATNSNYFWSATNETTGAKFKKAKTGHRTIWQLLNDALFNNDELAWNKWKELITNSYGLQLYRLQRGLKQKILQWQEQHPEDYYEVSKKKSTTETLIIWLPKQEWNLLKNYFPSILGDLSKLLYLKIPLDNIQKALDDICNLYQIEHSLTYDPYSGTRDKLILSVA